MSLPAGMNTQAHIVEKSFYTEADGNSACTPVESLSLKSNIPLPVSELPYINVTCNSLWSSCSIRHAGMCYHIRY